VLQQGRPWAAAEIASGKITALRISLRRSFGLSALMMPVVSASAFLSLAPHGKLVNADSMYLKGKAFIVAAVLLERHQRERQASSDETDYVFLHLLCQGIELVLKGLLLRKDYDKYIVRLTDNKYLNQRYGKPLRKDILGHNLLKIADEALRAYKLNSMRGALKGQLSYLSKMYLEHRLRYGSGILADDPHTIQHDKIVRRLLAINRLTEKYRRAAI
jgi:hypothetical protein